MKAYRIQNDIVAAHNEPQAIGTWAAHYDVDPKEAGPVEEVNPAEVPMQFEQLDGSFQDGTVAEIMPEDGMGPEIVAFGECENCG